MGPNKIMDNSLKKHGVFIGAVLVIIIVLGGFIYTQETILRDGETTILKTRPVDPRDLLRGEYVILNYAISADEKVQKLAVGMPDESFIYIMLDEDEDGIGYVSDVSTVRPATSESTLWITGEVRRGRVHFPTLEQYFVSEGAGHSIEAMRDDIHVEVVIKDGHARVTQLLDAELNPIDPKLLLKKN